MQGNAVRLVGRLESHASRSFPSTDGAWYESTRRFALGATSLGPLSGIDEWDGAVAAAAYSALGLGTGRPVLESTTEAEHNKKLTAQAKDFYGINDAQWQGMDYSIRGVPVRGALTRSLRNRPVAHAQAMGLREWEHDEDVRDLHVLVFKPFRLGTSSRISLRWPLSAPGSRRLKPAGSIRRVVTSTERRCRLFNNELTAVSRESLAAAPRTLRHRNLSPNR